MPEKVKPKPKAAKKSAAEISKLKKKKKKVNLSRLYSEMNKLGIDANDKEISKRFKTIIDSSEDDITRVALDAIIKDSAGLDLSNYHESLHPYIKHYLYMAKRNKNKQA